MRLCEVQGCAEKHAAKGLCKRHYMRLYKYGDLNPTRTSPIPGQLCSVDDCVDPHYGNGFCKKHYNSDYKRRNRPIQNHHNRMRRSRIKKATFIPYTAEQVKLKFEYWGNKCWMCGGSPDSLDHVKPLSRGGVDCLANFRPACKSCNSAKKDRWYGVAAIAALTHMEDSCSRRSSK